MEQPRPYAVRRTFSTIGPNDKRVQVLCTLVSCEDRDGIVDDGTAQRKVVFADAESAAKARAWRMIKIYARPQGETLFCDVVQNAQGIDIQLYKQVFNII